MKNKTLTIISTAIFGVFALFWAYIAVSNQQGDHSIAEIFSGLYGLMALFGGILGLVVGRKFGGFKSYLGSTVMFMSLGLLAQEAGQLTYSAYTIFSNIEIPYPSWGDVGYFGSVILYILAGWNAVKAVRTKASMQSIANKAIIVILPILLLGFSYFVFLNGYKLESGQVIGTVLDFGYPLGQALYIALALLALLLSRRFLGGIMKNVILLLIFAFVLQYGADFMFLYQHANETWQTAGNNELLYLTAYYVMTLSIIKFNGVILQLSSAEGANHDDN